MTNTTDIKRTMKDVIDSVEDLSNVDEAIQRKVRRALSGMRDILVRLPQDRLVEAEMVADQAKEFLTTASPPPACAKLASVWTTSRRGS